AKVGELIGDAVIIDGLVEKPAVDDAPSDLAVIGRYVLDPAVFDVLAATPPGRGGEIQLTDALDVLAHRGFDGAGGGLTGVVFSGRRYDTGDRLEYLKAVVQLAMEHQDLGPAFSNWLRDFVREDSSR
ncbi:MAG: UTP--glucose-1-phosphate uridylyltransferase, partial [Actinomycetes bacterium]